MEKQEIIAKINEALLKRALGYDTSEIVEEFASDGFDVTMVKKKVTTKNVPPDITAAKMLLDAINNTRENLGQLTKEQLEREKQRLLKVIKEKYEFENNKK